MRRWIYLMLAAVVAWVAIATPASAAGWGPRFGLTVDPDQVHFGAHVDAGYLADALRFQPNFELGIGDNLTVAAFNFDFLYLFSTNPGAWRPYLGGGPGANVVDWDNDRFGHDDSDLDAGLNLVGGIERNLSSGGRFLTEVRFGLTDSPDLKWTVGWTFRH